MAAVMGFMASEPVPLRAEGYLLKDNVDNELLSAIEKTLRPGGTYISPRLSP